MHMIRANDVAYDRLKVFLEKNQLVDKVNLLKNGYVVEIQDKIEGCFILEKMCEGEGEYWLKQLFITKEHAAMLPVLLEAILTLAKQQQAIMVYVHSYQPVVDLLLEALQFHPQKEKVFVDKQTITKGNWWSYSVS